MLVAAVLLLGVYGRRDHADKEEAVVPQLQSPFELIPALKFGALFIVVLVAVALGKQYLGDYGVLITAGLSAFVDVDATILSSLQTFKTAGITQILALQAITLAIIVNTLVKIGYVWILSRRDVAIANTVTISIISVVGILAFMVL